VAEYSRRVVTTRRIEYFLPAPTNAAEFSKAFSAAHSEAATLGDVTDDTITVDFEDEQIVISFALGDPVVGYERTPIHAQPGMGD
jgi:hypothetical protein